MSSEIDTSRTENGRCTLKLYTTDKTILMDVSKVTAGKDGLVIEGTIMGAMPLKTVLNPQELRAGLRLLGWSTVWRAIKMLITGKV